MNRNFFTRRARTVRSHRPGFLPSLGRELRDHFYYGNRIDWVAALMPASLGTLFGLLLSLAIEEDGKHLVQTDTLRWVGAAAACMLGGTLLFLLVTPASLAVVVGIDLLHQAHRPRKERRRHIRENIRQLRGAIVNDRIPLADLETVRTSLRVRDDSSERTGSGWYERLLMNRLRHQRARVEGLLEISWQEALPEALAYPTENTRTLRRGKPNDSDLKETTEVAWYLAGNPVDVAVQRLLYEYLPTERKNGNGYLEFRAGVVYTPRWVYELAKLAEQSAKSQATGPWSLRFDVRVGRYGTVGNECVPIGNVDRETVEKLYEPRGKGPLGSLRETVEAARNV